MSDALLAIDLGLRSGMAWFGEDGRLIRYRSASFADRTRFKRGVAAIVAATPENLVAVIAEGDPRLAKTWRRELAWRDVGVEVIGADVWRRDLLLPRERRDKHTAKQAADVLARRVIAWSGCVRPTSLTSDVAEAICIGLWRVIEEGWLDAVPRAVR